MTGYQKDFDRIAPVERRRLLNALPIPYNVLYTKPFMIFDHILEIECYYKPGRSGRPTIITKDTQIRLWDECVYSAYHRERSGWTLGIAGPGTIAYPEALAAQLASIYLAMSRLVLWVNITASLTTQRDLEQLAAPHDPRSLDAIILTGLRWEGDRRIRFDKAFDLLRGTRPQTDRIIVGVGEDPLAITREMNIVCNRAINITEKRLVNYIGDHRGPTIL